ncbi:hypothetical protein ACFT2C_06300 [Promicromonospora sp. NPDC057138]|uniref:hypothetical protein n=1 Tax=Promicromonospora sp. NPDC057138 TaxID=3346031 RepID=UPI0036267BF0
MARSRGARTRSAHAAKRVAALVLAGLLLVAGPAGAAATDRGTADGAVGGAVDRVVSAVAGAPGGPGDPQLLPVNRWSSQTNELHGRLGTFELTERVQRNATYPVLLSLGNSMWSGATGMTSAAIEFDILDSAGQEVDSVAAGIGEALARSGLLLVLVVLGMFGVLWRARRTGSTRDMVAMLLRTAVAVGLLAVMISGAERSTTTGGEFRPGTFSPGWIVTTTNDLVAAVASAPAVALSVADTRAGYNHDQAEGAMSCADYIATLKDTYRSGTVTDQMTGSVPLVMSGMWEATGLEVWSTSQFGAENPYGDHIYCRLLEQRAGVSPAEQAAITGTTGANEQSLAWHTAMNEQEDRTLIAWAQCRQTGAGWTLADGWERAGGTRTPSGTIADCESWWQGAAWFVDTSGERFADDRTSFEWPDAEAINTDANDPRVRNFLLTLHGHTGGGVTSSLAMVWAYLLASLIVLIVFGLIAIAVIVAKVSMVVMIIAAMFAPLVGLLPGRRNVAGRYLMVLLSLSLFVLGLQLILGFVTLVTSLMVTAGRGLFGGGSMVSMIWTGFAPAVGLVVVHLVFTKVLRLPSPLTLQGGQLWARSAASGALGGALGAQVMDRWQRRGAAMARRARTRVTRSVMRGTAARLGLQSGARRRSGAIVGAGAGAAAGGAVATKASAARPEVRHGARTWQTPKPDDGTVGAPAGASAAPARGIRRAWAKARAARTTAGRSDRADQARAAAARGAKNTALGRYREGLRARRTQLGTDLGTKGIARTVAARAPGAGRTLGAGALVVATGGLAAPVVAAVWGHRHLQRTAQAQRRVVDQQEAEQSAKALAQQRAAAARRRDDQPAAAVRGQGDGFRPWAAAARQAAASPITRGAGERAAIRAVSDREPRAVRGASTERRRPPAGDA